MLEARARQLAVEQHVIFHDRFVSQEELNEFLGAADIYITPYLNPEQSTSGTLAYAVGSGRAVISTPYVYARELLADDRGVLVPSRDAAAIGDAVAACLPMTSAASGCARAPSDMGGRCRGRRLRLAIARASSEPCAIAPVTRRRWICRPRSRAVCRRSLKSACGTCTR